MGELNGGWGSQWDPASTISQNNTLSNQPSITAAVLYVHAAGHAGLLSRPDVNLLFIHLCYEKESLEWN